MNTYRVHPEIIQRLKTEGIYEMLTDAIVDISDKGVIFNMDSRAWIGTRKKIGRPILGFRGGNNWILELKVRCQTCDKKNQCPNMIDGCCGKKIPQIKQRCPYFSESEKDPTKG